MVTTTKDISGYEKRYQVTNNGKILSLTGRNAPVGYEMKQLNVLGYKKVSLKKPHKIFYVHRLVAIAFIENKDNLPIVHHIDGDKTNNHVNNLMWSTYKYNAKISFINGRIIHNKGKRTLKNRICPICGKEFYPEWKTRTYCSRKCSAPINGRKGGRKKCSK